MSEQTPHQSPDKQASNADAKPFDAYWRSNLRLMAGLLVVWFAVPFGLGIVFVEPLNEIHLGGFPLGFWFAQQGSIYVFFFLVLAYAIMMRRLDREHGAG
ncbi:MAG: putative solute:sodium symporter small subunit [Myxococcota bacterium]